MFPASNAQAIQSQDHKRTVPKIKYKCVTLNTDTLLTVKCNLKVAFMCVYILNYSFISELDMPDRKIQGEEVRLILIKLNFSISSKCSDRKLIYF